MDNKTCAHFKFLQAERLNVINLTGDTYLSNDMSGSTIIADITSGSFSLHLPKPESGLNYRIIIKASTSTLTYTLNIIGTSDDKTSTEVINYVGLSSPEYAEKYQLQLGIKIICFNEPYFCKSCKKVLNNCICLIKII